MGVLRQTLLWCSEQRWLAEQAQRRRFTRRAVQRFMPGEAVADAVRAAEALGSRGVAAMLHELGENVTTLSEADSAVRDYGHALDRIADSDLDGNISVKLTHLGLDFDMERTFANLTALADHAARHRSAVWIDMEGSAYTDRTIELYRRVRSRNPNVGICLQAYLYRTPRDLEDLIPLAPFVRLVKGAYKEPQNIAYPRRKDVDASFYDLAKRLLDEDARRAGARLAVGTHDLDLIGEINALALERGIPQDRVEIQMLYGIQAAAQLKLASSGHPVRVLISYGSQWYPWFVRRLAERPANLWFVLRNLF